MLPFVARMVGNVGFAVVPKNYTDCDVFIPLPNQFDANFGDIFLEGKWGKIGDTPKELTEAYVLGFYKK